MPNKNNRTAQRRKQRHHNRIQQRHDDTVVILDPETVDGQAKLVSDMLLPSKKQTTSVWSDTFSNMWESIFG